ncbi:MAG: SusC/RagA family TonB-linked outer membrane protein [Alistipes ihumii]
MAGEPLVGVTVMVKNTTTGTTTDALGHFQLSAEPGATLVFSYLGYNTQEVAVGNKTSLKVVLQDDSQNIDEVVVVAYGTQKKASVTGSISTVQSKELKQSSSANLSTALAGRLSGLTSLQQGGGQPGKDQSTLMLRGAATLNGKTPIILIDGVPRDNMDYLSADEVDNISVLKDASATAVFGVRGANGAILITTKRGQTGKAKLDLNFEQSWTSFTREPERLTSLEYIDMRNQASLNDHKDAPFDEIIQAKYADPLKGLDPNDPDYAKKAAQMQYLYPNHDYYRELIKRYTPQTRVNMNISGGTEKVKYFVNAAYLHQGGNLKVEPKSFLGYDPSAKMDRYSFRANLDYQVTKSFKAFLNLGTYIEQVNMPSASTYPNTDTNWMMRDILYQATTITPITPGPYVDPYSGLDEKALVFPTYLDRSAMEVINRQGYHNDVNTSLNATLGGEWDLSFITKGLSLKGMASYDALATTTLDAAQRQLLYVVSNVDDVPSYSINPNQEYSPLTISKSAASRYTINLQASLNYNRTFGLHTVGGLLLVQRDYWEKTGGDLPYNVMGLVARATLTTIAATCSSSTWATTEQSSSHSTTGLVFSLRFQSAGPSATKNS